MIFHLPTLQYDEDILLLEAELVDFKPFESGMNNGTWFDHAPNWLQGRVRDERCQEVFRVMDDIQKIAGCTDIRPRFYKQEANTEVPMHVDLNTKCSVNIILSDNSGPVVFEDHGEIMYKCAILDTTKRHGVPSYPEERILLKYSIFDQEYEYVCRNVLASSNEVSVKQTENNNLSSKIEST